MDTAVTIKIAMVPREEIGIVWPEVGPMLNPAVMRTKGRYHIADILEALMQGLSSAWIAYDTERKNEIVGCVYLTIVVYPTGQKIGRVDYVGGKERGVWFDIMGQTIVRYVEDNGCDKMEVSVRPGLIPYLEGHYGAKKLNTNMELDLTENHDG